MFIILPPPFFAMCLTVSLLAIKALLKLIFTLGMESTAHYAETLTCFLYSRDFNVCIINPIQTSTLRKTNIRKTKTDSVDTYLIIKALMMNQYRLFSGRDYDSLQLKNLCRFRQKLMKARTKVKIQLVTYVDLLFPELQYFFKFGIHGKSCCELLKMDKLDSVIKTIPGIGSLNGAMIIGEIGEFIARGFIL